MPSNVVKTARDERLWERAKKQAAKQGKTGDYAYIMGIFQNMKGAKSMVAKASGGGRSRSKTNRIPGGLADKRKPSEFDAAALEEGIKVELEHTNDRAIAREIAMDHLTEDKAYYRKLKRVEKSTTAELDVWLRKADKGGSATKPPGGFTPIPNSKMGGYHRKTGSGYEYWYPGIGVTRSAHAGDAGSPPGKPAAAPAGTNPAATKKVITEPSELPDGFNDMPKEQRAALTANWKVVDKQMRNRFGAPKNYSGDLGPAIEAHIDELAQQGTIVPANGTRAKAMLTKMAEYGQAAGLDEGKLAALMEENVRKLAHQEIESASRTLGDHGVRHLSVNAQQSDAIFDELKKGGINVEPIDHFMAYQVWIDHDMGYTIPVIARGGFAVKDNYHPQASALLSLQQRDKLSALFGAQGFNRYARAVANHSGTEVDWKSDYFGSTVRLADNTHLFADKMPEVLFDSDSSVEALVKIRLAAEVVGDKANRTPEQKQRYKTLVGGVKRALVDQIEKRDDLPRQTKDALIHAAQEIGEMTPKFLISRLAGRNPQFRFNGQDMEVAIEQSDARETIGRVFGDDETDKQFIKLLKDYGTDPQKALAKKPPPPAVYVGEKGRGIEFSWKKGTRADAAEQRHSEIMTSLRRQFDAIQAMDKGPERQSKLDRFFGVEVAKAVSFVIDLVKAGAGTARRDPDVTRPIRHLTQAQLRAQNRAPAGFEPVPNSRQGGYRKRVGARYVYWYPHFAEHERAMRPHVEDTALRRGAPVEPTAEMVRLLGSVVGRHGEAKVKQALEQATKGSAKAIDKLLRDEAAKLSKSADVIPITRRVTATLRKRRTERDLTRAVKKLASEEVLRSTAEAHLVTLEPKVTEILGQQAAEATGEKAPSRLKAVLKAVLKGGIGPFVFGFVDNFLLYLAGASIDRGLATMGFSAAAVAGLGNAVSDSIGQGVADKIESVFDKIGLGDDETSGAIDPKTEARIKAVSGIGGVFAGAIAGMVPMLFGVTFGKSEDSETDPSSSMRHTMSPTQELDTWLVKSPAAVAAAVSAATTRAKPSRMPKAPAKESLIDKVRVKLGKRPPGAGWQPIPGGKKQGYRRRSADGWSYWYPGMGHEGGTSAEASAHLAQEDKREKRKQVAKEIARLERESNRWQERAASALDRNDRTSVNAARKNRDALADAANKLRREHGFVVKSDLSKTMVTKEGKELHFEELEDKIRREGSAADPAAVAAKVYREAGGVAGKTSRSSKKLKRKKRAMKKSETPQSYWIKSCLIQDSGADADAVACLESDGIGSLAHTRKSSIAPERSDALVKGAVFPAMAIPGDYDDAQQREQQLADVVHYDAAGNHGNGGLQDWFRDTWADQEHVKTPEICLNLADLGPTRVIDDSTPFMDKYVRQDPRGDMMALELAYKTRE